MERSLKWFATEIRGIQATSEQDPIQGHCSVYIRLRELKRSGYHIQEVVSDHLFAATDIVARGAVGTSVPLQKKLDICAHCLSVHYVDGQKLKCPWKGLSVEEARKKAAEVYKPRRGKKKDNEEDD